MNQFELYWKIIIAIILVDIIISSILFSIVVTKGKTLFPKWLAVLNPAFILTLVFPVVFVLPAPIGGYIAPMYANLSTLVFMTLTTLIVYKKLNKTIEK